MFEQFKAYVAKLRSKSTQFKDKKAEVSRFVAEMLATHGRCSLLSFTMSRWCCRARKIF